MGRRTQGIEFQNENSERPLHRAAAMGKDGTLSLSAKHSPQGMTAKNEEGWMPNSKSGLR
jgi:hypothetical protein